MLGSDWLVDQKCKWDFECGRIVINGHSAIPTSRKGPLLCRRVFVEKEVINPTTSRDGRAAIDTRHSAYMHEDRNGGSTENSIRSLLGTHSVASVTSRNCS